MHQAEPGLAINFLLSFLDNLLERKQYDWVVSKVNLFRDQFESKAFYTDFGMIHRNVSKIEIILNEHARVEAEVLRRGFNPSGWQTDQATRTIFLLLIPQENDQAFLKVLFTLFDTADLSEQMALYGAFPLLPYPKELEQKFAEGVRTNIVAVFEKIAFQNPYPADYLDIDLWNQMVIKTIFLGKNINEIYGLDGRRNLKLSLMARDLAHERWAAGRVVRPELWRLIVPYVVDEMIIDVERLISSTSPYEQEAGALLTIQSQNDTAMKLLETEDFQSLKTLVEEENLTWERLAEKYPFNI